MSLSDCIKCWVTPCTCGYGYKDWSKSARINQAAIVLGVSKKAISSIKDIPVNHPQKEKE